MRIRQVTVKAEKENIEKVNFNTKIYKPSDSLFQELPNWKELLGGRYYYQENWNCDLHN